MNKISLVVLTIDWSNTKFYMLCPKTGWATFTEDCEAQIPMILAQKLLAKHTNVSAEWADIKLSNAVRGTDGLVLIYTCVVPHVTTAIHPDYKWQEVSEMPEDVDEHSTVIKAIGGIH